MAKKKVKKIQVEIEQFTSEVLNKLVGIKGGSLSEVVNFMLKEWIGNHSEELKNYEIFFERKE